MLWQSQLCGEVDIVRVLVGCHAVSLITCLVPAHPLAPCSVQTVVSNFDVASFDVVIRDSSMSASVRPNWPALSFTESILIMPTSQDTVSVYVTLVDINDHEPVCALVVSTPIQLPEVRPLEEPVGPGVGGQVTAGPAVSSCVLGPDVPFLHCSIYQWTYLLKQCTSVTRMLEAMQRSPTLSLPL